MCGTDCFLMLLSVLYVSQPPLRLILGTASPCSHSPALFASMHANRGTQISAYWGLGEEGSLWRRFADQPRALLSRISAWSAPRVVHHSSEPRSIRRIQSSARWRAGPRTRRTDDLLCYHTRAACWKGPAGELWNVRQPAEWRDSFPAKKAVLSIKTSPRRAVRHQAAVHLVVRKVNKVAKEAQINLKDLHLRTRTSYRATIRCRVLRRVLWHVDDDLGGSGQAACDLTNVVGWPSMFSRAWRYWGPHVQA